MTTDDSDADANHSIHAARVYRRQNTRTDKVVVYWVSYLDGVQRVLLLSQDESIAKKAIRVRRCVYIYRSIEVAPLLFYSNILNILFLSVLILCVV